MTLLLNMDSVRSGSPLFSGSDQVELPSVAQGNLISFDPEEESRDRANVIQDKLVSTSQDSIRDSNRGYLHRQCRIVLVRASRLV